MQVSVEKCSRQKKHMDKTTVTWKNSLCSRQGGQLGQSTGGKTDPSLPQMLKWLTLSYPTLSVKISSLQNGLAWAPCLMSLVKLYFCFTGFKVFTIAEILSFACQCAHGLSLVCEFHGNTTLLCIAPSQFQCTTDCAQQSLQQTSADRTGK